MVKCWFFTPQNDNISIVNIIPNIPNLCEILNCPSENYLFFKQFEIRNKNEGKIYTVAFNGDATELNSCATNYFSKKVQHLCTYKSVQLFCSTKILVGKFVVFVEKVDRTPTLDPLDILDKTRTPLTDEESDEEQSDKKPDEEPEFIDVDLSENQFIKEFNSHEIYDMII
jgi:hypothetical protein